ncbi:MAG: RpiB/LacA/LacB family sugar-phosphate isomerase [Patescibacteria group bacterium]
MKIYLGADHRGYYLKEKIKEWLLEWGHTFEDAGATEFDPTDDYTIFAERVASVVAATKGAKGILICGSGVGVDVMANKFDGVRASFGKTKEQVRDGRTDDDMNILIMAADFTNDNEAKQMLKEFLETEFSGVARYKKRLSDIKKIEANN